MIDPLNPGAPISGANQAKIDKENLKSKESQPTKKDVKCNSDNPCKFGKWNVNFNKHCLNLTS